MSRVSQELLIAIIVFTFGLGICLKPKPCQAYKFHYLFSLAKAPDDTPLWQPMSIFIQEGKIYVVDTGHNRLVSFNFKGEPLKEFDAGGQLKGPMYMLRDKRGRLWLTERLNNALVFIDIKAHKLRRYTLFFKGHPVVFDKILYWKNKLLVLDRASGKVLLLNEALDMERVIYPQIRDFVGFFDIKIRGDWLWGLENMGHRLIGINLVSGKEKILSLKGVHLVLPVAFEFDQNQNVYILDRDLKKIFIFDEKGIFRYSFLKEGFRLGQVHYPWDIKIYKDKLFIVDEGNGRIDVWGL